MPAIYPAYTWLLDRYVAHHRQKREVEEDEDYPSGEDANPILSGNTVPLVFMSVFGVGLLFVTLCICVCSSREYVDKRRRSVYNSSIGPAEVAAKGSPSTHCCCSDQLDCNGNDNSRVDKEPGEKNNNCPACMAAADSAKNKRRDDPWWWAMLWCYGCEWCDAECGGEGDDCIIGVMD